MNDKPRSYFGKDRYKKRMWRCIEHVVTPEKVHGATIRYGIIDNDGAWLEIIEIDYGAPDWCSCPVQRLTNEWALQSRDDFIYCICGCQERHAELVNAEAERASERILEGKPPYEDDRPPIVQQAARIAAHKQFDDCRGQHTPNCVRIIYPKD